MREEKMYVGIEIIALGGEYDGREFMSVDSDEFFTTMNPEGWPSSKAITVPNSSIKHHDRTVFAADYLYIEPRYGTWLRDNGVIKDSE